MRKISWQVSAIQTEAQSRVVLGWSVIADMKAVRPSFMAGH